VIDAIVQTIGRGNFAKVKEGWHVLTGVCVAVKIVDKNSLSQTALEKV
jgi:serine/threonine protein kinase